MDREKLTTFIRTAETDLASVRSSLLIVAQTGDSTDLDMARRNLARVKSTAVENGRADIAVEAADCGNALIRLSAVNDFSPKAVYPILDHVARIEASLFEIPLRSGDFLSEISSFVDASFDGFMPHSVVDNGSDRADEEFEIDEETLDIFRSEADDILANIAKDLRILAQTPNDQNALWDIRRNAHTFKGAAGIVGLKEASEVAHRMEDLLDKMVELRRDAVPQVVAFLDAAANRLNALVSAKIGDDETDLDTHYQTVMVWLSSSSASCGENTNAEPNIAATDNPAPDIAAASRIAAAKTASTPIVRVSLERLDELIKVSRSLLINRSALAERFGELTLNTGPDADTLSKLRAIFEAQKTLTDELHAKLLRIRMVKFGTLETRLNRVVHTTCLDENKKATVELENSDVEIDTQMIDALIEPLLHLLKNAVVHGIESPDTRRLIGKPERGTINVRLEADDEAIVLSVTDDGGGISAQKLKEKAVAIGILDAETATSLIDREAYKLIFDRGLTTADKVDLNAGRGVGMSIVKESVEDKGGSVVVESEARKGTTFTILMPLNVPKPEPVRELEPEETGTTEPLTPLVLVVDDSASIRRQTTKIVEEAGLRVITANNGAEALELLLSSTCEPDLILSDVEMPHVDGWEFLEYVKTDDNFGHIPVVMITSLDKETYRQRAIDLGASDYLNKPFSVEDLEATLAKVGLVVA